MSDSNLLRRTQSYVQHCLDRRNGGGRIAALVDGFLITLIGLNVLAFVLETVQYLDVRYGAWFDAVLHFSIVVFTLELLLRVWTAPLDSAGLYTDPIRGRLRFLLSPMMLVDLAGIRR